MLSVLATCSAFLVSPAKMMMADLYSIYLGFVFLLGLPMMGGELLLGRRGHRSPVNSIAHLIGMENASSFWLSIGWLSLLVPVIGLADFTVANVLLPVNALLIALFAGWVIRNASVQEEFDQDSAAWRTYWRFTNRYFAPVAISIIL